jgi:ABC-2 type transport system ATP-binding protein
MEEAVRIRDLNKSFRGHLSLSTHHVLRGVSLTVPKGVIYGFLGPNGAGKTTTLKILTGLLFPDGGEITVLGKTGVSPKIRRRIGFLPESPYFYDYLTGAELLSFLGRLFGIPKAELADRSEELLKSVGLENKGSVQLRKYSKGMLQRIGLAQALINDPELVILDEPVSGLDPVGRREMRDLILDLKTKGKTVFFSSHILSDAESICDEVAILMQGQVVKEGTLDKLLGSEIDFWDVTLRVGRGFQVPEGCSVLVQQDTQVLLRVEDEKSLERVLDAAREAKAGIRAVVPHKSSLEDLFMAQLQGERPS